MREPLSLTRASLYAGGAFAGVMAVAASAAALAIGGPLTGDELAGIHTTLADAAHGAKALAHRARAGVCRRLPTVIRMATPCPKLRAAAAKPHAAHASSAGAAAHHATSHAHAAHAPRHPLRRPHQKG